MTRYLHKRRKKHGLPPGSLVFMGEAKTHTVGISVFDYDGQTFEEFTPETLEAVFPLRDAPTVSWINVNGVHDVELVRRLGEHFGIHPLVLEDIVSLGQRPKLEQYEDYLYLVVKMHALDEQKRQMTTEQVSLLVGPTWVLSFQEDPGDVFDPVRHRLRGGQGRLRKRGADYLAYALLDVVVDHYFLVLEAFSEMIENLEDRVLDGPLEAIHHQINDLRRELILLRRTIWPVRELLSVLDRSETRLIRPETRPYFRDVYDHAVQVLDVVESLRDVLGGLMDLYMSSLSNRMNEIMKFLTIIGTIFIPLTFIAGIYGMNFDFMPELHYRLAYPLVWLAMILLALGLMFYFRRKHWL